MGYEKMKWNLEAFVDRCGKGDFLRGREYFERGRVIRVHMEKNRSELRAKCVVAGSKQYRVELEQERDELAWSCTCPRFEEYGYCKHVAAALLECIAVDQQDHESRTGGTPQEPARQVNESDDAAKQFLSAYMDTAAGLAAVPAHLMPALSFEGNSNYPSLTFQVGIERMYVVRNIVDFLRRVKNGETFAYGKKLTLCHRMEQFDDWSQRLILLLMDQLKEYRTLNSRSNYDYGSSSLLQIGYNNAVRLTGSAFDQLFDLLREAPVPPVYPTPNFRLCEEDPEISFEISKENGGAVLKVHAADPKEIFFGSNYTLYSYTKDRLCRCSRAFLENVYPVIKFGEKRMRFALHDLPALCSCVLPEIERYVTVRDPDNLLQEYGPDECTPCFYFDMEDDVLSLRLMFRYGEEETLWSAAAGDTPKLKRDARTENSVLQAVRADFGADSREFALTGDDAAYTFLTERLPRYHELGDVYVSDRLRGKHIQPKQSSVGISLSDGTLLLELSTGGFPPEELEALYQSLLKKRKYHRLADGRYLTLDGSPCEKLAEMAHMLQLTPEQLVSGRVELPAFRGLYLDGLLKGENEIQVNRDRAFRAMVRNFKSVAESDYTVPGSLEGVLRPYQKVGFRWLKTLESVGFGGILADEMGLGKTLQVIAFLLTAKRSEVGLPSLVVCPASLILNWSDELARFAPELRTVLVMGTAAERKRLIAAGGEPDVDVWVTSYELLRQDIAQYEGKKFYACVLDEGQHIKNRSTLASKAVKRMDARQRFVLTGTPIENRLSELWNLFDFLMPGYLFTHNSFVEKLEKPVIKSRDEEAGAQLRRLVQPFLLRRLKKDVLRELPPKVEHIRRIPLSGEERKTYHASASAALQSLAGGAGGKLAVLAALTRLRQICCAPDLCFENYDGPRSKLDACMELCAGMVENGHQILLFSQFTSMLDILRERLNALQISNFTLQGSTPKPERARLVKAFNAGGASVFLISLKAGGTGLNLTAADVVIHYDPWWNLAAQEQATDRAHRIGQQSHVQVYKLIAQNSIEERILDLQTKKAALMDTVSGDGSAAIMEMTQEDLLALLE